MLDVTLPSLHDSAAHIAPAFAKGSGVRFWKMQVLLRHREDRVDAVETQLAVGALEGERVICRHLAAVAADPFVHPPKVRVLQRKPQLIDQPRNERQLLGGTNRATNAKWVVVGGLSPGVDVLECFGQIKILERVVHCHTKTGARQLLEIGLRKRGRVANEIVL